MGRFTAIILGAAGLKPYIQAVPCVGRGWRNVIFDREPENSCARSLAMGHQEILSRA
jgi:hypothetical protein